MTPLSLEDRGHRISIGSLKGCAPALTRPGCTCDIPHLNVSATIISAAIRSMSFRIITQLGCRLIAWRLCWPPMVEAARLPRVCPMALSYRLHPL